MELLVGGGFEADDLTLHVVVVDVGVIVQLKLLVFLEAQVAGGTV